MIVALLAAWPAASLAAALLLGRCIRAADRRERPTQRDLGLAA